MRKRCTIIGAGISGLSLAAFADEHFDVTVLEASDKVGGLIQNNSEGVRIRDHAANGWLNNEPSVNELIQLLNLEERVITANQETTTRWIIKNGQMYALSPKVLFSELLPLSARIRLFAEPFIKQCPLEIEESLAEFGARRFGAGIVDELLAPFASGIFACRPEEISLPAAFPKLWKLEQEYGSMIKAHFKKPKPAHKTLLTSMKGGTSELCQSIADKMGDKIILNTPALSIKKHKSLWSVNTGNQEILSDYLAITCPASAQKRLLENSFPKISKFMSEISYSSVAVVIMEFPKNAFPNPPVGFGALMNRAGQETGILGTLFSSCIFPSRQQDNVISTRTIMGGSIMPEMLNKSQQELQAQVLAHHESLFGKCQAAPLHCTVVKYQDAIPRYEKGHFSLQKEILSFHNQHPSLRLSGNHLFGVAVKDCIRQSKSSVLDFLEAEGKASHA